jgi:hypothetical protein
MGDNLFNYRPIQDYKILISNDKLSVLLIINSSILKYCLYYICGEN